MDKFLKYTVIEYQKRVVIVTVFTKHAFCIDYVRNICILYFKVGEWKIKPKNTKVRFSHRQWSGNFKVK